MRPSFRARRALPALLALPLISAAASAQVDFACPPAVRDAAGGGCLGASSVPAPGMLLPLGPLWFVEPLGNVGLGTTNPVVHLDVVGTGGNPSTIRTLTTNATGAGGLLLQREGPNPVDWSVSFASGPERDFLIHDNVAADTRMRIDEFGTVHSRSLRVGRDDMGLYMADDNDTTFLATSIPNGGFVNLRMGWGTLRINGTTTTDDIELDATSSITFKKTIGSGWPMMYMFDEGVTNDPRMVLAHSPAYPDWGLLYDDGPDAFRFVGGGQPALTVDLGSSGGNVGIGVTTPSNILTVKQGSASDPIADSWTTYSSRRWKENIEPMTGALGTVRALRGVTYDWKATGEHDLGMIAEEVGAVLPELVQFEENGVDALSIDYGRLSAVLVEAVKELSDELSAKERALEELTARVERLEQSVGR